MRKGYSIHMRTLFQVKPMKIFPLSFLAIPLLLLFGGCGVSRNMATINNSSDAEPFFFDQESSSAYNLYYHGPDDEPIAYLALQKDYRLQSDFWFTLRMNEAVRKRMTDLVADSSFRRGSEYIGKEIIAPGGETISYILTSYHWVTAWFDEADPGMITIPPPELSRGQPIPLSLAGDEE